VPDLSLEVPTRENGGISPDGSEVTYRLRDDVTWHDGQPVTSADVAFTLEAIVRGELLDEPGVDTGLIELITVVDEHTLTVRLTEPAPAVAGGLAPYVLPEHLLADSEVLALDGFWRAPVGSGPYRVDDFVPGTEAKLEPVDDPDAVSLDVVFSPDVQQARRLFDGAPRAVWLDPPVGPASDAESFDETPSIEWARFEFNHRQSHSTADPAVREALTLLTPTLGSLDPGPYGPSIEPRALDTTTAEAVLDAAGWRMGEDGVRTRDGEPLRVHVVAPPLLTAEGDRIEALLLEWEAVGFSVRFTIPGGVLYGSYYESPAFREDEWDVAWMELPMGMPADSAYLYRTGKGPTWERPYGLNFAGIMGIDETSDVARAIDEGSSVAWVGARMAIVLAHGVDGVGAETVPTHALLGAPAWRAAVDEGADGS
jgi:ABC-type transport system substrate-binding protein